MSFTNTHETHLLTYTFTATSVTRPTAWYIGLFTGAPGEAAGGTEISGNAYARKTVAFTISGNAATNTGAVEFTAASGGNWGTITHLAVFDASSGGNMIVYSALSASKTINDGDAFRIPASNLSITLD
tara:strand:- start:461 stop:844 length:384 start_codon:yes stop_codon:yes gene_type:complete